ncbi:DUF5344 family protein [Rossellomorea marisflavi]|uniref:DUF5344 family protein n=1 Tax=Rossellomorea marisflavi TaxID=189381 RepID=UPI0025AF8296|nr:DUF5344 family protein [Rossellomorea marisflavi]WJV19923.1 DUF5344 family protein [Rossellomorea marisflavi]
MDQSIILQMEKVQELLERIQSSSDSFDPVLVKDTAASNHLDVVTKLNEINTQLEDVAQLYKKLLTLNNISANKAILDLNEMDTALSASIRSR